MQIKLNPRDLKRLEDGQIVVKYALSRTKASSIRVELEYNLDY